MASYNGELYIKEQINSILFQLSKTDELIISDDGSTDNTIAIINKFHDDRIRLLFHKNKEEKYQFKNTTKNIEFALQKAKGDIIFLADQDDVWLSNKVSIMLSALNNNHLVVSNCKVTDANLNIIIPSYFNLIHSKEGLIHNLIKNSYLGCCMAFRRELLNECLPFPDGPIAHDIWIGLIAEKNKKVKFIETPTLLYRRHVTCVSTSSKRSSSSLKFKIYHRFYIVISLIKHHLKNKNT